MNYRTEDFFSVIKETSEGIDMVLEVVGGEVFRKSLRLLNPFGRLVVAGYASNPFKKWNPYSWWLTWKHAPKVNILKMATQSSGIMATHIGYLMANPKIVKEIWSQLSTIMIDNQIKPIVGKTFSFEDLPQAHEWIESRNSMGKVVVSL